MEINIKFAEAKDVDLILLMIRELAEWEGYSKEVVANKAILTESLFGERSVAKVLLAYSGDASLGYMIYCPKFSSYTGRNEIYLQDVYLRKEARGTGTGLALMSYLARVALKEKATRIEWFVDSNNTKALSFYENLGANVIDAIKVMRLEGASLSVISSLER